MQPDGQGRPGSGIRIHWLGACTSTGSGLPQTPPALRRSDSKARTGHRKLILEDAQEASEFVYEVYTIADHFTFTERPSDAFVFTTTHANWVNLGFNFGSLLPDPDGLLRGEGKWIRHVRIAQAADLTRPGFGSW